MGIKKLLLFANLTAAVCGSSRPALAAIYDVGALSGVMVQPASNYYLLTGGAYFTVSAPDEWIALQVGYFERPRFSSMGFVDQDYGGYLLVGRSITQSSKSNYGLWAGFGCSRIEGYIRPNSATTEALGLQNRGYLIDGMSAALEAYVRFHGVRISLAHHTFVGLMQKFQVEANVAWPFNFVFLKIGFYL